MSEIKRIPAIAKEIVKNKRTGTEIGRAHV